MPHWVWSCESLLQVDGPAGAPVGRDAPMVSLSELDSARGGGALWVFRAYMG
jgi:hypothetical protein